ncbi:MAG: streptomycin 6-kinase [Propionibacteriaceae bacterium]|nr:streptomycin 6-kinase [Propionibacteriaceae bacterium]
MPVVIPEHFLRFAEISPSWSRWIDRLPRLMSSVLAEWQLQVDGPVATGQGAVVVPVLTAERRPAAVKFGWPHPEAEHEHLALRAWGGSGAVQLLRADPHRSVLLLERAHADRDLTTVPVLEACQTIAGFYRRLHRPAIPQLDRLSDHAKRWANELTALRVDNLVPRRYVEQAASLARDFAADPATDGALLHTDLHYFNVLAADREPWLVIDPKPLSGDPAYEVAPVLWNRWDEAVATGNLRNAILDRLYAVVDTADLDEDRARAWVVVREMVNVKWAMESAGAGRPLDAHWVTIATTITKAVQR